MIDLAAEYYAALCDTPAELLRALYAAGCTDRGVALAAPALVRVQLHGGILFEPDPESSVGAFIVPVRVDCPQTPETPDPVAAITTGKIVDLVAFTPGLRVRWALRRGTAEWLGACTPQYMQPDPVRLYRTPLDWMRAGCEGLVCLATEPLDIYRFLTRFYRINVEDEEHAEQLFAVLDRPAFQPEILIGGDDQMADETPNLRWLFDDEPNPAKGSLKDKPLGLWSGAEGHETIPPARDWLLGNTFCRGFLSSIVAEGGTGKSALRMAQALAIATGRPLTGEKVFEQTRTLYISLEDDAVELRRRLRAALLFHDISYESIRDWLFLASPGDDWNAREPIKNYTLAYSTGRGEIKVGEFLTKLSNALYHYQFGLVIIDPFIKLHALNENSNAEIDFLCRVLASLAMQYHVAIDLPHHTSKLTDLTSGSRSNRARGGSAFRDAVRLLYTLSPMSAEEGTELNVNDEDRRFLVRLDPGKLNVTVPATKADWYRLVGVPIGNGNSTYPNGDSVQTVTPWDAPDFWAGITITVANQILDVLDQGLPDGRRYSTAHNIGDDARKAWRIVLDFAPDLSEAQAKLVIHEWTKRKLVESRDYDDPTARKSQKGLFVLRRPG